MQWRLGAWRVAALVLPLAGDVQAGVKSCGTLSHVKTAFDQPIEPVSTWSQNFQKIASTSITFKIGGKGKSCVLVTYSAQLQASIPSELWLKVVLDGKMIAQPGPMVAESNGEGGVFKAHSFTWIFPAVSPGRRTVHVEFKSSDGSVVSINQQTLVVQYR
jgi:hypothetical protein